MAEEGSGGVLSGALLNDIEDRPPDVIILSDSGDMQLTAHLLFA